MTNSTKHTLVVLAVVLAFALGMMFQYLVQPSGVYGLGDGSNLDQMSTGTILNVADDDNDWTQNALTLNGSNAAEQVLTVGGTGVTAGAKMNMRVTANSAQDPQMVFTEGNGSGSPGNMQYLFGYDASENLFRFRSYNSDGASTDSDFLQILDGTKDAQFLGKVDLSGGSPSEEKVLTVGSTATAGGAKMQMRVQANSAQDPQMLWSEGNGSGSAGNMQYLLGYDASANLFRIRSYDSDGSSTDSDILQIIDGTKDVKFMGNITSDGDLCIGSGCP